MSNLTVFNLRSGFANNSSSTHSVIFFPSEDAISINGSYSGTEFGWNNFTLTDTEDKKRYLLATLKNNIQYDLNESYLSTILNTWCGLNLSDSEIEDTYVDHQSLINLPRTFDGTAVHQQYFQEIQKLLLAPTTVILGGNDNSEGHPLFEEYIENAYQIDTIFNVEGPEYIAKFDNEQNYWTLFNRYNGNKIRMLFTETGTEPFIPTKAETPDLVDVKITDFCAFNCSFCYQGSTVNGKHASVEDIEHIIRCLSDNEVFEIAFGGGEPTQHPNFIEILQLTKKYNIVPNFTTKNFTWVKKNFDEIKDIVGSFAFSISYYSEIEQLAVLRDYFELPAHKIAVQYVMGTQPLSSMLEIVEECAKRRIPITLLGFKTQERGVNYQQFSYDGWLAAIKNLQNEKGLLNLKLGIDTALVQQSTKELQEANIPKFMYHCDEGMFSWYIDAVAKKMGPSSYAETSPFKNIYQEFFPTYNKYRA